MSDMMLVFCDGVTSTIHCADNEESERFSDFINSSYMNPEKFEAIKKELTI